MSAVTSVSVAPVDGDSVNRIKIINKNIGVPAYYNAIGYSINDVHTQDGGSSTYKNWSEGRNYPRRASLGKEIIEVVLNGEPEFCRMTPEILPLKKEYSEPVYMLYFYYQIINSAIIIGETTASVKNYYKLRSDNFYFYPNDWGVTSRTPILGMSRTSNNVIYKLYDIKIIPETPEAEYLGTRFGQEETHIVFNGDVRVSIPDEAQQSSIDYSNVYDENGNLLALDIDESGGFVVAYSVINGVKVETKAYGLVKINYTYTSHSFCINYESKDFYINAEYIGWGAYTLTDNKGSVSPSFYHIKVKYENKTIGHIYQLNKKVEIIQFSYNGIADSIFQYFLSTGKTLSLS